jgi:hypothetical protein
LSLSCSKDFILQKVVPLSIQRAVSLEILNGGHYYFVADAFNSVIQNGHCKLVITIIIIIRVIRVNMIILRHDYISQFIVNFFYFFMFIYLVAK